MQPMSRKSYEKIHQILTLTFKLNTNISGVLSLDGLSFIILIWGWLKIVHAQITGVVYS